MALLEHERDELPQFAGEDVGAALGHLRGFVERVFHGRSQRLWELGLDDLIGQSLAYAHRPVDAPTVAIVNSIAAARRGNSAVDAIPAGRPPVRLMNIYQVKGREMDYTYLVHAESDVDPWKPDDITRLRRVQYVGLARARKVATVVLPPHVQEGFTQFVGLCAD
jgi:hypothetical protein